LEIAAPKQAASFQKHHFFRFKQGISRAKQPSFRPKWAETQTSNTGY